MSIVLFNRLSIQYKAVFLIQYKFLAYLRYVSKYQCSDFLFEFAERIVAYETKFFWKTVWVINTFIYRNIWSRIIVIVIMSINICVLQQHSFVFCRCLLIKYGIECANWIQNTAHCVLEYKVSSIQKYLDLTSDNRQNAFIFCELMPNLKFNKLKELSLLNYTYYLWARTAF